MAYMCDDSRDDAMKNQESAEHCTKCPENQQETTESAETDALSACKKEVLDTKNLLLRVRADFDNYKKRVERDRAAWNDMAQASVLKELLPVVDDFDRAIKEHQKKERTPELDAWLAGFELIAKSLNKFLQQHKVTEITEATDFDPHFHDAFAQIESPEHASGQIVDVVQRGYKFKDTVLRPARVVVAK